MHLSLSEYLLRPCHPDTPIELRGAVRLAGKYLMDQARADMIKRVTMDWPSTLEDWDAREDGNAVHSRYYWQSGDQSATWSNHTSEPVSAIVFAQENGCTEILPVAFYRLASIDIDDEWGTANTYQPDPRRRARWSLCDKDNLVRWIRGRKTIEARHRLITTDLSRGVMLRTQCLPWWVVDPLNDIYDEPAPVDPDMADYPCLDYLWTLRDTVWKILPAYDPLQALSQLDPHDYYTLNRLKDTCPDGLCDECRYEFERWLREERVEIWKRLPQIFKLK